MIPYGLNLRFFGRSEELDSLSSYLREDTPTPSMKVVSVHRLGGVGKTQLALQYVNTSMEKYDVVAWFNSDTQLKLLQSISAFAAKLGILESNGAEDDYQSVQRVRDWLNTSKKTFLLVFDNLEDAKILDPIWPSSPQGSVIITTRSRNVATKRSGTTIELKCFADTTAVEVLYQLTGQHANQQNTTIITTTTMTTTTTTTDAAFQICQRLGSLPLAMVQMASYIRDRGVTFEDFLTLFDKHKEKLVKKGEETIEYEHTLSTVWDISLDSLSAPAKILLGLLALFDPDSIQERFFTNPSIKIVDKRLEFLKDEFEFGELVVELTRSSLVSREDKSKCLSLHRLVQLAVFLRLSTEERQLYLDTTIQLLSIGFPNTWDQRGDTQGHSFKSWETCSAVMPHVFFLMSLADRYQLAPTHTDEFAELIFRIGTYLWEKEQPNLAQSLFQYGLNFDLGSALRLQAQAYRLKGHIGLDAARPRAALAAYLKALGLRRDLDGPTSLSVGEVYDSVACSYTEIGDVASAFLELQKAESITKMHSETKSARTQAIYAMTYLRANEAEKAMEALQLCWKLQNKNQEDIEKSQYPKHSGDIVLLARIKHAMGEKEEGQRLASRTISLRRGVYGAKGPRVADSLYVVSCMLREAGEDVIAAKLLREVIEMSTDVGEMTGHLARSLWFLAQLEDKLGNADQAVALRERAHDVKSGIQDKETGEEDSDDAYLGLVGWMLW